MINYSKNLAKAFSADGVLTNCIVPGVTLTEGVEANPPPRPRSPVDHHRRRDGEDDGEGSVPAVGRFGDPAEVAAAVVFLAGESGGLDHRRVPRGRRRHAPRVLTGRRATGSQANSAGSARRWILPIELRSKPSTNSQRSGTLYRARLARQCSVRSSAVKRRAGPQLHRGDDPLAQPLVGDAHDRARLDDAEFVEHPLDLGRVHVRAAPDDQQALAVADVQVAVVVDEPEIAGVEHAVAQHLGARVGPLPVAEHRAVHARPTGRSSPAPHRSRRRRSSTSRCGNGFPLAPAT